MSPVIGCLSAWGLDPFQVGSGGFAATGSKTLNIDVELPELKVKYWRAIGSHLHHWAHPARLPEQVDANSCLYLAFMNSQKSCESVLFAIMPIK